MRNGEQRPGLLLVLMTVRARQLVSLNGLHPRNTTGTLAPLRDRLSLLARDWGKKGSSGDKQRPSD